jgi:hypothetical protein
MLKVVLSDNDIFCGDTFVMTISQFDTIEVQIKNNRLYINNTFVKEFSDSKSVEEAVKPLIKSLEEECIDFDYLTSKN